MPEISSLLLPCARHLFKYTPKLHHLHFCPQEQPLSRSSRPITQEPAFRSKQQLYSNPIACSQMSIEAEPPQFHVLAVDDSLTDRKLIERLLRVSSSCQVTTVDSGSKALEFLGLHEVQSSSSPSVSPYHQEIEVNLIITDYCMPGMTGYDLLKRIKESESMRDIPVVIMSSEYTPSRISRCLEGGAEEFFAKPVQLSDVKKLRPYLLKGKSRDDAAVPRPATLASNVSGKRKAAESVEPPLPRRPRHGGAADNLAVVTQPNQELLASPTV